MTRVLRLVLSFPQKEANLVEIQLTNEAANRLKSLMDTPHSMFKIVYDTDGCGCAVNGVPALWLIDSSSPLVQPESDHIASEEPKILYEARHEVFFEDKLILDYNVNTRSFKLSSTGQIYTNDLQVFDKRQSGAIHE